MFVCWGHSISYLSSYTDQYDDHETPSYDHSKYSTLGSQYSRPEYHDYGGHEIDLDDDNTKQRLTQIQNKVQYVKEEVTYYYIPV